MIHEISDSSMLALSTGEQRELRFFRKLGIRRFRSVLLALEKHNHASDGEKNINYHPVGTDEIAVQRYMGYLLYHTVLHAFAVLFGTAYIIFLLSLSGAVRWFLVPAILLYVLNCICILLQREEYLLIKDYRFHFRRRLMRRAQFLAGKIETDLLEEDDGRLAFAMLEALEKGNDFILRDKDIPSICRLAKAVNRTGIAVMKAEPTDIPVSSEDPVCFCRRKKDLYDKKERKAAFLQNYFTLPGSRSVLEIPVFVTESQSCEEAFRALFPDDSRRLYLEILTALCFLFAEKYERETEAQGCE